MVDITDENFKEFNESVGDDLNTAKALKNIHEVMNEVNSKEEISEVEKQTVIDFFETVDLILGVLEKTVEDEISIEIIKLAENRKIAKEEKNFSKADELRVKIQELGYEIKDDKSVDKGYIISKK